MEKLKKDSGQWVLSFTAESKAVLSDRPDGQILENGKGCISFFCEEKTLRLEIKTYSKDEPLFLWAPLNGKEKFELVWRGYRTELILNGETVDEEWPIGDCFRGDDLMFRDETGLITGLSFAPAEPETEEPSKIFTGAQFYAPKQGEYNVGDCMPFFHDGVYHAYFLKDRHSHQSKWRLGAHQFAHISSKDLIHWETHPLAVPITHDWEGSICTGSFLHAKGKFYAFYAVRMSDYTSARLSWATSDDGIHFTKSERYFSLDYPYETTSARDPEVFLGEDGNYHMLVTTDLLEGAPQGRTGCLAHLISSDLENWEQLPPFYVPGYTDQPECTDYFSWNGYYYLIFSNYGCAKYRYSKQPFGPWLKPEDEVLDGLLYRVPKTAAFTGNRRIACGFLTLAKDGRSYAGNMIFRELVQNKDGTLSIKQVPEMLSPFKGERLSGSLKSEDTSPYQMAPMGEMTEESHLCVTMKPSGRTTTYGLVFQTQKEAFELRVEPFRDKIVIAPLNTNPFDEHELRTIYHLPHLDQETKLELVWHHGILDLCVNDRRTLICRLTDWEERQKIELSCFVKDGECAFSLIK